MPSTRPARPRRGRPALCRHRRSPSVSSSSGIAAERSLRSRDSKGFVGPWEEGFLYGSAAIFLFVLAVGAFITVTMKTEAIQTGIGRLAMRFSHSGSVLIAILMASSRSAEPPTGCGRRRSGSSCCWFRSRSRSATTGWSPRRSSSSAPARGVIASTVNPFATGVASDAAGIRHRGRPRRADRDVARARADRRSPTCSGTRGGSSATPRSRSSASRPPTPRSQGSGHRRAGADRAPEARARRCSSGTFLVMIYGFIPWNDLWQQFFSKQVPAADVRRLLLPRGRRALHRDVDRRRRDREARRGGNGDTIVAGAADFLGAALIVVLARGITVVMKNSYMTDTVLHWMENAVSGSSKGVFGLVAFIVNLPIAFLVPSSSGHAALVMPILAPLVGLRGRAAVGGGDRFPVGLRAGEPRHADLGRDHGRAGALEGRLRPLPEVRLAVPRWRYSSSAAPSSAVAAAVS